MSSISSEILVAVGNGQISFPSDMSPKRVRRSLDGHQPCLGYFSLINWQLTA